MDINAHLASGESVTWVDTSTRVLRRVSVPSEASTASDAAALVKSELASDGAANIQFNLGTHDAEYECTVLFSTSLGAVYVEQLVLPVWQEQ